MVSSHGQIKIAAPSEILNSVLKKAKPSVLKHL